MPAGDVTGADVGEGEGASGARAGASGAGASAETAGSFVSAGAVSATGGLGAELGAADALRGAGSFSLLDVATRMSPSRASTPTATTTPTTIFLFAPCPNCVLNNVDARFKPASASTGRT